MPLANVARVATLNVVICPSDGSYNHITYNFDEK